LARQDLLAWLELHDLDVLSGRVLLVWALLATILASAIWVPLAAALAVCALIGLVWTVWFWAGLVLSTRRLVIRDLGFVVLTWAAGLWWWTVFVDRLSQAEVLHFTNRVALGRIAAFFSWQLVDLVPLVDVDETLTWNAPLHYEQALVGICVLAYDAFVVLPIIALVRRVWRQRSRADDEPQRRGQEG
jgi:hypothetical protein